MSRQLTQSRLDQLAAVAARNAEPVFVANGWKLSAGQGLPARVPGRAELEAVLKRLLGEARKHRNSGSACGRFCVGHWIEDGQERFSVTLTVGTLCGDAPTDRRGDG